MANYLDLTQRREIEALARSFTAVTEWPTWLLLIGVYTCLLYTSPSPRD